MSFDDIKNLFLTDLPANWEILSQEARITVFMLMAVSAFIAYQVAKWRYSGIADNLQSRVDFLNEKLDRSESPEISVIPHDTLLKERALKFVSALNEFISEEQNKLDSIIHLNYEDEAAEEDRSLHHLTSEWTKTYSQSFKIEAISLKSELITSLPKYKDVNSVDERVYSRPVNFFGLESIATELQKLALNLDSNRKPY